MMSLSKVCLRVRWHIVDRRVQDNHRVAIAQAQRRNNGIETIMFKSGILDRAMKAWHLHECDVHPVSKRAREFRFADAALKSMVAESSLLNL